MTAALILVDVQSAFVEGPEAVPEAAGLLPRIAALLDRARAAGVLVVHLQNDGPSGAVDEPGGAGWQLALEVRPGKRETVVRKRADDGFDGTGLADLLSGHGVELVILCGVLSEMCVSATARGAMARGLRVILPHDTHASYDIPAAPGLAARVPARQVARVAEWALGDEVEIVPLAAGLRFDAAWTIRVIS
jgi:nicotinamidase-related amidase